MKKLDPNWRALQLVQFPPLSRMKYICFLSSSHKVRRPEVRGTALIPAWLYNITYFSPDNRLYTYNPLASSSSPGSAADTDTAAAAAAAAPVAQIESRVAAGARGGASSSAGRRRLIQPTTPVPGEMPPARRQIAR